MNDANAGYARALGIGVVSGLRSMTGPASALRTGGGAASVALPIMALGEMVADKLPGVPARTSPAALAVRALSGGFAGVRLAGTRSDRRLAFALGAAGAIAASYLALRLRRGVAARTGLPDPVIALFEDAAAVSAGLLLSA